MMLKLVALCSIFVAISGYQRCKIRSPICKNTFSIDKNVNFIENVPKNIGSLPQYLPVVLTTAAAATMVALADPTVAMADTGSNPVVALLTGRTASMIHPITNMALFGTSIYSAYLGLRWRSLRGMADELKALSNQLPQLTTTKAKFPIQDQIKTLQQEIITLQSSENITISKITLLQEDIKKLQDCLDLDRQYTELTEKRKRLLSANLKDKHHMTGSILVGVGVTVSLLGAWNTYLSAGELFPGPHLFAGLGITILWACK